MRENMGHTIKRQEIKRKNNSHFGLSLRKPFLSNLVQLPNKNSKVLEIVIDNYQFTEEHISLLSCLAEKYLLSLHCVGFSLADPDQIDHDYLANIKKWTEILSPISVSDHLCWSKHKGHFFADLLPFPLTQESFEIVKEKVIEISDTLQTNFLVENISSYIGFKSSTFSEAEFLGELCEQSGCKLLFDVQNCYANSINSGQEFRDQLNQFPQEYMEMMHVAGGKNINNVYVDTHSTKPVNQVIEATIELSIQNDGIPIILEWDTDIPEFDDVSRLLREYDIYYERSLSINESANKTSKNKSELGTRSDAPA